MSALDPSSLIMAFVWTELSSSTQRIHFSNFLSWFVISDGLLEARRDENVQFFIREKEKHTTDLILILSILLWVILEHLGAVLTPKFGTNELKGTCQAALTIIYIIKHVADIIIFLPLNHYQWKGNSTVLQYSHPFFYKACQGRAATILYYSHHCAQSSTHQCTPL